MPISPKYTLSGENTIPRAARKFTDREEFIAAFKKRLAIESDGGYNVLVYYGVGGIGKTTLRKHLGGILEQDFPDIVWSTVDFDVPAYREQETALYLLRKSLRNKYKIQFPSFELAYTVYWQKTHPQTTLKKENFPLLEEGGIVFSLVSGLGSIPFVGLIPGVTKAVMKGHKYYKEWWLKRGEKELKDLPSLEAKDIAARLPMFWASDLKDYIIENAGKKAVIFLDTYEALWENSNGIHFNRDEWIREFVSQIPGVLFVICGREKLRWEELDKEWEAYIDQHLVGSLSRNDTVYFLESCSIERPEIQNVIIDTSKGVPYYLDLAVDTYYEIMSHHNREPVKEDFAANEREVLDRFLRYLDIKEMETLRVLSNARIWNREIFSVLVSKFHTGYPATAMDELCRFSFIKENPEMKNWKMHGLMRDGLRKRQDDTLRNEVNRFLFEYYSNKLEGLKAKDVNDSAREALQEAFYHGMKNLDISGFCKWFKNISQLFYDAYEYKIMIPLLEEFAQFSETTSGENDLNLANSLLLLSEFYNQRDSSSTESEKILKKVLEIREQFYGEIHPLVAEVLNELGNVYLARGDFREAEVLYERAIEIGEKTKPSNNINLVKWLNNLALLYFTEARYSEAEPLYKKAIELHKKFAPENDLVLSIYLSNLGLLYAETGNYIEAKKLLSDSLNIKEKVLGEDNPNTARSIHNLGKLYVQTKEYHEAEIHLNRAIKIYEISLGPENQYILKSLNLLARVYVGQDRLRDAEKLFKKILDLVNNSFGMDNINAAPVMKNLGLFYLKKYDHEKSHLYLKKALDLREQFTPSHPDIQEIKDLIEEN